MSNKIKPYNPGDYPVNFTLGNSEGPILHNSFGFWHILPIVVIIILTFLLILTVAKLDTLGKGYREGIVENIIFWGAFWIVAVSYLCFANHLMIAWFTILVTTIFPIAALFVIDRESYLGRD